MVASHSQPREGPRSNAPLFAVVATALLTMGPLLILLLFAPAGIAQPNTIIPADFTTSSTYMQNQADATFSVLIDNVGTSSTSAVDSLVFSDPGSSLAYCTSQPSLPSGWNPTIAANGELRLSATGAARVTTVPTTFTPCFSLSSSAPRTVSLTVTAGGTKTDGTRLETAGLVTLPDIFGLDPGSQSLSLVAGVGATTSVTMAFARSVATTIDVDVPSNIVAPQMVIAPGSVSAMLSVLALETSADDSRTISVTLEVAGGTYDAFAEPVQLFITEAPSLVRTDTRSTQLVEVGQDTRQTVSVRLAKPALNGPVFVGVQTPDSEIKVLSDALLTFTGTESHDIVVEAVNDLVDDGTTAAALVLNVKPGSSSEYLGLQRTIGFTVISDDLRGINVQLGALTSSTEMELEEGLTTEAGLSLRSQPTGTVAIDIVSQLPAQALVKLASSATFASSAQLVFTPTNWDLTQSIDLLAVADTERELTVIPVIFSTTVHAVGARDSAYDDEAIPDLTLRVIDMNDRALLFTSLTGSALADGPLAITEGDSAPAKVRLAFRPEADVQVGLAVGDGLTAATTSFLFTPANWDVPQSLGITASADGVVDLQQDALASFGVINALTDDGRFWSMPTQSLAFTIADGDVPGLVLGLGDGLLLGESAPTSDTFTVRLAAKPAGPVNVAVEALDTRAKVGAPLLTFSTTDWSTPQTVGIASAGSGWSTAHLATVGLSVVTASSHVGYHSVPAQETPLVLIADTEAILLSRLAGTLTEGASDAFTVRLAKAPVQTVSVTLTATVGLQRLTLSTTALTFAPGSQLPQTVTVTGIVDALSNPDAAVPVVVEAVTGDTGYLGKSATITWTIKDRDPHAILLSGPVMVSEGATASTATVQLNSEPDGTVDVVVAIIGGQATTPSTTFRFTPASGTTGGWDVPQTISVSGIADGIQDGHQTVSLQASILTAGTDLDFAAASPVTVAVQVNDLDIAGLELPATVTVTEGQSASAVGIRLLERPGGTVELQVVDLDTTELDVGPTTLVFNDSDFDVKKTVSVLSKDDDIVGAGQSSSKLTLRIASGTPNGYAAGKTFGVTVVNLDNDAAGFTVSVSGLDTVVGENAGTDAVGVRLTARPGSAVVFTVAGEAGEIAVNPSRLTFSTTNFNVVQTVTVTGINNALATGIVPSQVTFAIATAASNVEFRSLTARQVPVTILDDDAGLLLSSETLSVTEGGAPASYGIALSRQPAATVTITPAAASQLAISPSSLVFTAEDWQTPKTLSVTALDDLEVEDETVVTILHAIASADNGFRLLATTVSVTVQDNDLAVTEAQLLAYNQLLQDLVRVSEDPSGGNRIDFSLPPSPPAPVAGVQVFAANSPFVLVKTLDKDSAEFKSGRFVHLGSAARDETRYLVTAYFGKASALGFATSTDPEGEIAGFDTLGDGLAAVAPKSSFPAWVWIATVGTLLLVALVAGILVATRRRGPAPAFGSPDDDLPAEMPPVVADALAGRPTAPVTGDTASCRCPACQTLFTVAGLRPLVTNCPGCGKRGVLR